MINSLFDNSSVNNVSLISQEKTQFQCYYLNSTSKALHHECFNFSANTNSLEKCDRWIYDLSVFQSTIVTEVSTKTFKTYKFHVKQYVRVYN